MLFQVVLSVFPYHYCADHDLDANLSCKIAWTGATLIRVKVAGLVRAVQ
jgi:hypothetical protein